jgi:acyl-CoA thioester hydrolase
MGVAYHAHYLVWCEVGRTDLIRELGMPYRLLEQGGLSLAVAEAHVRYVAAARYDDVIRVRTWLERVQSRAVTFGYELRRITRDSDSRIATAETKLIALDRSGAPRILPASLVERFREFSTVAA